MTQLLPNFYRSTAAENFVKQFEDKGLDGNYFYVFATSPNTSSNTIIYDNVDDTLITPYNNMIFGKLVEPTDVILMIRRVDYQSGTVYAMYDDQDISLNSKNFFVSVNDGDYHHVFKCLNNNNGGVSTVNPSLSYIGTDGIFFSSADKYTWHYMYSIDIVTYDQFATDKFIPFVANTIMSNIAIAGSIDSIKVNGQGVGYSNFVNNATFSTSDIQLFSNSQFYGLSGAVTASLNDDFYKGCIIQITSGTGRGQYRNIISYQGNANTKYITLESPFDHKPDGTSQYSIYPGVYVYGDQTQTTNAVAVAYVDWTSGNTISRVEMLNRGAGYKSATANVYAHSSVGVTPAYVRPILSPAGGHGADIANELYCNAAAISIKFTASESNTIPTNSHFNQIGVIQNPVYTSANIHYSSFRGAFVDGETVYCFYPRKIQERITISAGTTAANVDYTSPYDFLAANTLVYVTDGVTSDQLFRVDNVANNTALYFKTTSLYDFTNATMYALDIQSKGTVSSKTANTISLEKISGHIKNDAYLIGEISGGFTNSISSVYRSDQLKDFSTFIGTYKYRGSYIAGEFSADETITQVTNAIANGILYTSENVDGSKYFYVTNQNGTFNTSNTITGTTSGAIASITDKYLPEIQFGSGKIIYMENFDSIVRNNIQTETFKLIFEF